jgi:tight adherence protein B
VVHSALLEWADHVSGPVTRELHVLRNRMKLGQPARDAVASIGGPLADDAGALAALVAVHARCGGDAARMIDRLAESVQRRHDESGRAESHGAGAKLSARLVAGLPLAFVPLAPMAKVPLADRPGLFMLALGVGLAVAGLAWISALFPKPETHDDPAAAVADVLATAVEGGGDVAATLAELCRSPIPGLKQVALRIERLLALGVPWSRALERADDPGLASLGAALEAAVTMGLPLVSTLRGFAAARRADRDRLFEAAVKRAPVRMTVPLAVCVLPSFVLLGIGPFLRGISLTS